jgi:hypothetical protein
MIDLNMPAGMSLYNVEYAHKLGTLTVPVGAFNPRQAAAMAVLLLDQMVGPARVKWTLTSVTKV